MDKERGALRQFSEALERSDRARLTRSIAQLLDVDPPLGHQWKSVAKVAQRNGEVSQAVQAMRRYADAQPGDWSRTYELATIHAQCGLVEEARALIGKVPDAKPSPFANAYFRGTISTSLGLAEEARSYLDHAVALAPQSGQAWLARSYAAPLEAKQRDCLVQYARSESSRDAVENSAMFYALAREHDRSGEFEDAVKAWRVGAAIMRTRTSYDPRRDGSAADETLQGWSRDSFADPGPCENSPIFIAGLPRSGTTLVERVLSSHSAVSGGGELGLYRILEQEVGGRSHDAHRSYRARCERTEELDRLYLRLALERIPGAGRIVDKGLDFSRHAGLMMTLFPDSPVIWLRRTPVDCAWSAYSNWFARGLGWSWSLEDIARHFLVEDRLFAAWRHLLGERLLVVQLEDLVANSREIIAQILRHCGLADEAACYAPHTNSGPVATVSAWQVRKPINSAEARLPDPYRQVLEQFERHYTG